MRGAVSEPPLGEYPLSLVARYARFIYANEVPAHPVAQALAAAVEAGSLPKQPLVNLIESRRFDLYDDAMPTLADLEGYLGETSSVLIQMAALILAGRDAAGAAEAAGLAGVAYGMALLLNAGDSGHLPPERT